MRGARRAPLALLALALCAALAPTAASAAPRFTAGFRLHHGRYDVRVENIAQSVLVSVEAGALEAKHEGAETIYAARGEVTEGRLRAGFGELGSIAMRFHPAAGRSWVKPQRDCEGAGRLLVRHGTWQGRFHFRGEGGYIELDLHRVRGEVATIAPRCRRHAARAGAGRRSLLRPARGSPPDPEVPLLRAGWRLGTAVAQFAGAVTPPGSSFVAFSGESRGQLAIFRAAEARGPRRAVTADRALTRARVAPPAPFHGRGRYRAAADGSTTWSGDLSVSFPGERHFELTGQPFKPKLELFPELFLDQALSSSPAAALDRLGVPGLPGSGVAARSLRARLLSPPLGAAVLFHS